MMFRALVPLIAVACGLTVGVAAPVVAEDVLAIGEVHDNPLHHSFQADRVTSFLPSAIIFEMLTADQAARITPALRDDPVALEAALDWANSGWPDFGYYYPIMAAAPTARIYGAGVPRDAARAVMTEGLADTFGLDAAQFGLTDPLPQDQQAARLTLQAEAHCNALPPDMLPAMIDIQRLRDAVLAQTTLAALDQTGGPVVVIAGNGHLRRDWGMPAFVELVAPELTMNIIGQSEDGIPPSGTFDSVMDAPAVERPDPCAVFQ